MHIQRLKDKLGNRSNASSEVEYRQAAAWLVGEPGRGVATIIEMVSATRLDCVLGSAAAIRQAVVLAVHHASHRSAFGASLIDQPAMTGVLADLALESEAATALALRLAGAADRASRGDAAEAALLRIALPAAKYWICKRTPMVTAEALECLGGNGYVEESVLPRLLPGRPAELDLGGLGQRHRPGRAARAVPRPDSADALLAEVAAAEAEPLVAAAAASLRAAVKEVAADPTAAQRRARRLAGQITVTLQAALLVRYAPAAVANAFCASRLGPARGRRSWRAVRHAAGRAGPGGDPGALGSRRDQ